MATIEITQDGKIDLYKTQNNSVTLNVNGNFDGGTLTFGYRNNNGIFTAYANNSTLSANGEIVLDTGHGVKLMVDMTGSTSPSVNIEHHGWYDG